MGTLNHFAKDVGIPVDLEAAVRNLFTGQVSQVDVGEVNGRVFVNNSGLGLYPRFVRRREELERRGHVRPVAFMLASMSIFRRDLRLRLKAQMDGEDPLQLVTPFLFVGNNRYETSGFEIGTRPRLDSGKLWVCTAPSSSRKNILVVALRTLVGLETDRELNVFEADEIWVEPSTPTSNVSMDGEVGVMDAPLHYRIRPRALSVIAPDWGGSV